MQWPVATGWVGSLSTHPSTPTPHKYLFCRNTHHVLLQYTIGRTIAERWVNVSRASSPSSPLTIIITTLRKNLWKSCLSSRGLDGFGGGILKRAFHSSWYMLYKWGKDLPALNLPSHLAGIYLIERLGVGVALVEGTSLPGPWVAFGVCSPEVYHSLRRQLIIVITLAFRQYSVAAIPV